MQHLYLSDWKNIQQPKDANIKLVDVLENLNFDKEPYVENYVSNRAVNYKTDKFNTLRASAGSRTQGIGICNDDGW